MAFSGHLDRGLSGQGAANAVVEGLGQVGAGIGHHGEVANRDDRIAGSDAHVTHLFLGPGADVDVHVILVDDLFPFFLASR